MSQMTVSQKLRRLANVLDIAPELAIPVVVVSVMPNGVQEVISNVHNEDAQKLLMIALTELGAFVPKEPKPPRRVAKRPKR